MTLRIGTVGYATRQGLGYLMKSFHGAGVVQSVLVYEHPDGRPTQPWYPNAPVVRGRGWASNPMMRERVDGFLDGIDICLFFETPFDWSILSILRKRGIASVLVPMYEWFPLNPPDRFDGIICPSKLDQRYFHDAPFLPIPVDGVPWQQRKRALRYLHNAGGIGSREHKGTRQLIEALPYLRKPIKLTIRAQNDRALRRIVDANASIVRAATESGMLALEYGDREYDTLWDGYDVLVQPEKYNGLSLPLQEAFAAGMLVMTTDRFPANDWLPGGPLIEASGTQRVQAAPGHNWIEETLVSPERIAWTIDAWHGAPISDLSLAGRRYAERNSWTALREAWVREIAKIAERVKR